MKFSAKNPHLRVAAKRCSIFRYLPDKFVGVRKSYSGIFRPLKRPRKITEITFLNGYICSDISIS